MRFNDYENDLMRQLAIIQEEEKNKTPIEMEDQEEFEPNMSSYENNEFEKLKEMAALKKVEPMMTKIPEGEFKKNIPSEIVEPSEDRQASAMAKFKEAQQQMANEETQQESPMEESEEKPMSLEDRLRYARINEAITKGSTAVSDALAQYAAARAGGRLAQIKPLEESKTFDELAESQVEDLEEEQKSEKAETLKERLAKLKAIERDRITPYQQEMLDRRTQEENRRITAMQADTALKAKESTTFNILQKERLAYDQVSMLLDQVEKGNENALNALGTKLARAMGEVGVLTDADVTRYVGGTTWYRNLTDWYNKRIGGDKKAKLSLETLREMKNNMHLFRQANKKKLNTVYTKANRMMRATFPDMDENKLRDLIGQPREEEEEKEDNTGKYKYIPMKDGSKLKLSEEQYEALKKKQVSRK
jgi:hypothetical protein